MIGIKLGARLILKKNKDAHRAYREASREKIRDYQKRYVNSNQEKENARLKAYYKANPEKIRAKFKKYYWANLDKVKSKDRIYRKHKQNTDCVYRLNRNLRKRLWAAIKSNTKSERTMTLVGCSIDFLKLHLESYFEEGMTWENYGVKGWHVDHIKPCCSFDLSDPEQQKQCFHYSNLQPLWWQDNIKKSGKWDG